MRNELFDSVARIVVSMLEGFGITQVMKEVAYADDDLILVEGAHAAGRTAWGTVAISRGLLFKANKYLLRTKIDS